MSEIKPVYQIKVMNAWCDVDKDTSEKKSLLTATRILYPAAAYEALQKENAELREINDSLHRSSQFTYECQKKAITDLKQDNAAQAKRIAELEEKMPETLVINADTNLTISGSKESIRAMNGLALEAMGLRAKVAELDSKLHERTITSGAKIHELNAEIESLRKQVEDYEFRFGILKQIEGIRKVIGS